MRKVVLGDIIELLSEFTGVDKSEFSETTRVFHDARISGSDFVEFMDLFSSAYQLDFSGLDFSKLAPHEGWNGKNSERFVALTVRDLAAMARLGDWREWGRASKLLQC